MYSFKEGKGFRHVTPWRMDPMRAQDRFKPKDSEAIRMHKQMAGDPDPGFEVGPRLLRGGPASGLAVPTTRGYRGTARKTVPHSRLRERAGGVGAAGLLSAEPELRARKMVMTGRKIGGPNVLEADRKTLAAGKDSDETVRRRVLKDLADSKRKRSR